MSCKCLSIGPTISGDYWMQNPHPEHYLHYIWFTVLCCPFCLFICCVYKTLPHRSMSTLTGKGTTKGNEMLSSSVKARNISNLWICHSSKWNWRRAAEMALQTKFIRNLSLILKKLSGCSFDTEHWRKKWTIQNWMRSSRRNNLWKTFKTE